MKKSMIFTMLAAFLPALSICAGEKASSASPEFPVSGITPLWWIAPICSVLALITAFICYRLLIKAPKGNARMEDIAGYVRDGAKAYLKQQYSRVSLVFLILFLILIGLAAFRVLNPFVPVAFLTGGFFSGLCGFLGMRTATAASSRTAQAASTSLNRGLQVAFRSGAVMGLVVVGFGLLDITAWYLILDKLVYTAAHMENGLRLFGFPIVAENFPVDHKLTEITATMLTFGMGASTQALFARVGGGIYTKAADVGADLVGKVEAGIPEDDPRNPATIADNVGDNVGDVAGMGADLYESYCGSILATAALGAALPVVNGGLTPRDIVSRVNAPMIVAGIGIVLSIIGIFSVRCKEGSTMKTLLRTLHRGTWGSSLLILVACAFLVRYNIISLGIFGAIVSGLIAGLIIGYSTEYYTSDEFKPVKDLAVHSKMGPATSIINGLALGMISAGIPMIATTVAVICAFGFSGGFLPISEGGGIIHGLYGIGFAAVGMLSTLGITLATDAYGPIADNAGGNAEMSRLSPLVRQRTDTLDILGNTTAATGKGFAIGSAILTAVALLAAVLREVEVWGGKFGIFAKQFIKNPAGSGYLKDDSGKIVSIADALENPATDSIRALIAAFNINIMNPMFFSGLLLGGVIAFVFCALTMKAVGRAAGHMVEEVRRQFREIPGIMDGTSKPDYARCVEISTKCAHREMIFPALLAIISPVVIGLVLGIAGLMGLLAGGLGTGFALACLLNNAGGAWDNAKKHIEKGHFGGRKFADGTKNPTYSAAVIADTVGDPCKDTAGPSLNILVKLMTMVAIVFIPLIVKFSPYVQKALRIYME